MTKTCSTTVIIQKAHHIIAMSIKKSLENSRTKLVASQSLNSLVLTLSGPGGGIRFFLHNSKMPGDIEKKLSDFKFTPLMDILRILSTTIVVRCRHSNLLFPVCHIISWVEKTKKLELFSR